MEHEQTARPEKISEGKEILSDALIGMVTVDKQEVDARRNTRTYGLRARLAVRIDL